MPLDSGLIDFRNTNSLWASIAVETLAKLGLTTAIICPGSRSTPLTFAFARNPAIEALPILDERSAAFFALGAAKRQHQPVAIVCTSGTAGANFYPAVIEAYESNVPLLIFTADRPPEMRDCASGQTIDQQKLFGGFTQHYHELAVPIAEIEMLAYLRQTLVSAWVQAIAPTPGPIHFNCPFRDPLPPLPDGKTDEISATFNARTFFAAVAPSIPPMEQIAELPINQWQQCAKGLIIAGAASPADAEAYCNAISKLSLLLNWPVLAEGLSPLRNFSDLNSSLISTYDIILRKADRADDLSPEQVIQLGPLPISKVLRQWLQQNQPRRWVIGSQRNIDPLHGPTQFLATNIQSVVQTLVTSLSDQSSRQFVVDEVNSYTQKWLAYEKGIGLKLENQLTSEAALIESKVVWLLSQYLPASTPLFIANSMPVRDVECFWAMGASQIQPAFNRGANGIDGTLSTAMGLAHRHRPTVLLTGDLAFLHDTNGLLNAAQLQGHLTVVLINNNGGGIFEMLPVAQFEPEFETYFATPQQADFSVLCKAYGVQHVLIEGVDDFVAQIRSLPKRGVRVLEVVCDRKQSAQQRKALLDSL